MGYFTTDGPLCVLELIQDVIDLGQFLSHISWSLMQGAMTIAGILSTKGFNIGS